LNADLSGHRFLRGAVLFGRSELDWDAATVGDAAGRLAGLQADAARFWRDLAFNASFQDRLAGVGTVDRATASSLGVVGPAARAAGLAEDARLQAPLLSYPDFAPVEPAQPAGDVRARYEQRALELWQSFALLDGHLDRPLEPSRADPVLAPAVEDERGERLGTGIVEGPRGRTVCVVEAEGDRVRRLHLRTASFANWPAVAAAAAGSLLPDFPLINKSFELCYACVDR
jgi:Ni,Fe-hydrogenase III large subunit